MRRTEVADHVTVVYERDGKGWHVYIPSVEGCRSDGRSIHEARVNIREALEVSLEAPDAAKRAEAAVFDEEFRNVPAADDAARAKKLLAMLRALSLEADYKAGATAKLLLLEGFSLRDAGELLGVSHQHVKKLVETAGAGAKLQTLAQDQLAALEKLTNVTGTVGYAGLEKNAFVHAARTSPLLTEKTRRMSLDRRATGTPKAPGKGGTAKASSRPADRR